MKIKSGLNVFGSIKNGGSIIHVTGTDSMLDAQKAILYQIADSQNLERTWELDIIIHNMAKELHEKMLAEIKSKGVSEKLLELLNAPDKKSASRIARSMTINHEEFANLTYNYSDYGYLKESKFFEYIPDHLKTNDFERNAFFSAKGQLANQDASRFFRKITNTLKERKNVCAHLFSKDNEWHCFYFTYNDIAGERIQGKSHWSGGDHLHYISHFWGRSKEEVWAELSEKKYSLTGEHIKYVFNKR